MPCKSPVDYTILTWDIFRSTDPRQSPLSPDSRFASPIQVDRKIASISFTITSNHRSRRSPAKYNFFFFFFNSILSHFSLSLSFLSFQHNYDDFSTTLPDQIKTGRAPLSALFFFFLTQLFTSPRRTKRNPSDLSVLARQIFRSHLKRLSLKRSQCEFGLLCRVQHPGRHSSRLQMIWRLTSGFSRRFAATLTLVG